MSKKQPTPPLTLASTSPFRKELLKRLGVEFSVVSPGVDEAANPGEEGRALALRLSIAKAQAVAATTRKGLIVGSDQVAVLGNDILGKPRDRADAIRQLTLSSGREMHLYTGLALVNAATGVVQQDVPVTVCSTECFLSSRSSNTWISTSLTVAAGVSGRKVLALPY